MTHTLVRERETASAAWSWEVVDEVPDEEFTAGTDDETSEWVPVSEEDDLGAQEFDARDHVVAVLDVLLDEWDAASAHESSIRRATRHPIYRLVLQAGEAAVPQLLARLERDANPLWIWALGDVTGEDPAAGTMSVDDAAREWLRWGAAQSS
jgi:hypothetical protein